MPREVFVRIRILVDSFLPTDSRTYYSNQERQRLPKKNPWESKTKKDTYIRHTKKAKH